MFQWTRICKEFMLLMPESWYWILRKQGYCEVLTVCFWERKHLLMIGIESLDVQQANGMLRRAWRSLEIGIWFTTFVEFLQVCFQFLTPLIPLLLVCQCSICTQEWIRLQTCFKSFSIKMIESWFDSYVNLSKSSQTQSLCVEMSFEQFDSISICIIDLNMHKISSFD